jgi:predicted dehydrogenase
VFHVSQVTAGRKNRLTLEVAGTEGALCWDSEQAETLWIGHRGRPNEALMRDPSLMAAEAAECSHYPGGHAEGFPDTFKQLYLAVYGWVRARTGGQRRFPTFADGHREVVLCEAIARSAALGGWVEVEPGPAAG